MKKRELPGILTIAGVELWNAGGIRKSVDVVVVNGIVHSVKPAGKEREGEVVDGKDKVLMPSGVDAHVHLRVPGQAHKERPDTALRAAIKGGYGAVLNMPNTNPPVDNIAVCQQAMEEMKPAMEDTGIEVYLSACITKGMKGEEAVNFEELARWGVKTFTDDGLGIESDAIMAEAFRASAKLGIPISQHAEFKGHGGILAGGKTRSKLGIPLYPPNPEFEMVERDLRELRKVPGAKYHLLHVSLARSIEAIAQAAKEGLKVSCEVTPHHLFFTFDDIPEDNTSFKMNPPLRDKKDEVAMQEGLRSGLIGFVATDHAPHSHEEKSCGFLKSPFGTTGMETSLLVLLEFLRRGLISEGRLVEVFSTAPAKYLGIEDRFGEIAEGRPFNAILADKDFGPHAIGNDDLASLSHNNVFLGVQLPGKIEAFFNPKFQFTL